MPRILVTTAFKFAVDGNHVHEIEPGEHEVSERCALVAVEHLQVATLLDELAAPAPNAAPPAPAEGAAPTAPAAPAAASVTPPAAKPAVIPAKAPNKPKQAPAKPKPAVKPKPVAKPAAPGDGA